MNKDYTWSALTTQGRAGMDQMSPAIAQFSKDLKCIRHDKLYIQMLRN